MTKHRNQAKSVYKLFSHNIKISLTYYYVRGFNKIKEQWYAVNVAKHIVNIQKFSDCDSDPKKNPSFMKTSYMVNKCEICDALYMNLEKNTTGKYNTCSHEIKIRLDTQTKIYHEIVHPDSNIRQSRVLSKLFWHNHNDSMQVMRHKIFKKHIRSLNVLFSMSFL